MIGTCMRYKVLEHIYTTNPCCRYRVDSYPYISCLDWLIDLQPCSFGRTKEMLWFCLFLVLHTVCVLHVQLWMTLYISLPCIERDRMNCSPEEINVRENRMGNQEWTIQRHRQHWAQDTGQINVRENRRGNQEWTIRRHMQQNTGRRQSKGR